MGKPTFDSRNSKTLVLGFEERSDNPGREVFDFEVFDFEEGSWH